MTSPTLILISHKLCPYVQRTRIVLDEKRIPHQLLWIDLSSKPRWFLEVSPLGQVPVLLVDGEPLFESAVVCEYLDEIGAGAMLPADPFERARHRSWVEYASRTLDAVSRYYGARDEEALALRRTELIGKLARLNEELTDGPYFGGRRFSLVDAAFAPVFRYFDVFEQIDDVPFFATTPAVARYRVTLARRPSVMSAAVSDYRSRLRDFLIARGGARAARATASKRMLAAAT